MKDIEAGAACITEKKPLFQTAFIRRIVPLFCYTFFVANYVLHVGVTLSSDYSFGVTYDTAGSSLLFSIIASAVYSTECVHRNWMRAST